MARSDTRSQVSLVVCRALPLDGVAGRLEKSAQLTRFWGREQRDRHARHGRPEMRKRGLEGQAELEDEMAGYMDAIAELSDSSGSRSAVTVE